MNTPKFSVITVSYNHAAFIRQTIESVLAQDYPNFEHIVIDGGSQDGTLDILRSYPHLLWVSEPDRGQSHALNKGFAKATGEIIAWINSDDWYPPGIFKDVAAALEDYPIVLGECAVTDKQGVTAELYPNRERNWFDILKYWVYESVPSQPSLFFRRSLLEEVRLPDGKYLDEDLDFCMDFELWLRMTKRYPLKKRIPKVLSYCRMYDTNKTGELMDATYREMSRVFHRHSNAACQREKEISLVCAVGSIPQELERTVASVAETKGVSAEILVADYSLPEIARQIRRHTIEIGRKYQNVAVRYARTGAMDRFGALGWGIHAARAPLVAHLEVGDRFTGEAWEMIRQAFQHDSLGILLPWAQHPELVKALSVEGSGRFRIEGAFQLPYLLPSFIARQCALLDAGSFSPTESRPFVAFKELLFRLAFKGWQMSAAFPVSLPIHPVCRNEQALIEHFQLYVSAHIIDSLSKELATNPFAATRAQHGFTISFPDALRTSASRLLELAPEGWTKLSLETESSAIKALLATHRFFAPAWYLLRHQSEQAGDTLTVEEASAGLSAALAHQAQL